MQNNDLPPIYTVYENPKDYPGKIVIRRWLGNDPDRVPTVVADTLVDARAELLKQFPCLVKLERHPTDDPVILETWI